MANTPKRLAFGQIPDTSINTIYTVPASTTTLISYMSLVTASGAATAHVDIKINVSGTRRFWRRQEPITSEPSEFSGKLILNAGDILEFTSDTGAVVDYVVCGLELS